MYTTCSENKEAKRMLWYCSFKWHSHTTRQQVAQRILEQHQARGNRRPESLKGWYNLAGGGAGFLLVETEEACSTASQVIPAFETFRAAIAPGLVLFKNPLRDL